MLETRGTWDEAKEATVLRGFVICITYSAAICHSCHAAKMQCFKQMRSLEENSSGVSCNVQIKTADLGGAYSSV